MAMFEYMFKHKEIEVIGKHVTLIMTKISKTYVLKWKKNRLWKNENLKVVLIKDSKLNLVHKSHSCIKANFCQHPISKFLSNLIGRDYMCIIWSTNLSDNQRPTLYIQAL